MTSSNEAGKFKKIKDMFSQMFDTVKNSAAGKKIGEIGTKAFDTVSGPLELLLKGSGLLAQNAPLIAGFIPEAFMGVPGLQYLLAFAGANLVNAGFKM